MSDECRFDHRATRQCVCDTHGDLATVCGIAAAALQARVRELEGQADEWKGELGRLIEVVNELTPENRALEYRLSRAEATVGKMQKTLNEAIEIIEKCTHHEIDHSPSGPPETWGCRVGLTDLEKDCRCWRKPTLKRLKRAAARTQAQGEGQ